MGRWELVTLLTKKTMKGEDRWYLDYGSDLLTIAEVDPPECIDSDEGISAPGRVFLVPGSGSAQSVSAEVFKEYVVMFLVIYALSKSRLRNWWKEH